MDISVDGIILFWVNFVYHFVAAALIVTLFWVVFRQTRHGGGSPRPRRKPRQ